MLRAFVAAFEAVLPPCLFIHLIMVIGIVDGYKTLSFFFKGNP